MTINGKRIGLYLLGMLFLILGAFLVVSPVVGTVVSVLLLGILFLSAGIIHLISAIIHRHEVDFWMHLIVGIISVVVGFLMLFDTTATMLALTLMISTYFLIVGLLRIITSLYYRFEQWGWILFSGILGLLLGILILLHWPTSSFWVIGLFLGIDLIFVGWAIIMTGVFLKKLPA